MSKQIKAMNPNIIEVDEKGIFCYEKPLHIFSDSPNEESSRMYQNALEAAKRESVYFRDQHKVKLFMSYAVNCFEQGNQYLVPEGYRIEINNDGNCVDLDCQVPGDHVHPYAILIKSKIDRNNL